MLDGVRTCIVNADVTNNRTRPRLMTADAQINRCAEASVGDDAYGSGVSGVTTVRVR